MKIQPASTASRLAATIIDIIILAIATATVIILTLTIPVINDIWAGCIFHC